MGGNPSPMGPAVDSSLYPEDLTQVWPGVEFCSGQQAFHICLVNSRDFRTVVLEISDHSQTVLTEKRWQEKVDTNLGHKKKVHL